MVASRAACLNRAQGAVRRLYCAHFDNSERPAGVHLCIYCDVRFATDFSPAFRGLVHPRRGLAKWLAGKVFPRCNRLREIQKSINAALAKSGPSVAYAMKSRYDSTSKLFLIFAFVCVVGIGTAAAQPGGRLIVLRVPNFGWNLSLHLQIDGRTVANVVQGRRYDHSIPSGRHVLTVSAVPNNYFDQPTSTVLNVQPGRTYVFTAVWQDSNRVVLVPSALPPGQAY